MVLYCAYDRYKDDEREEQHRIYVVENHSPDFPLPADAQWMSRADLDVVRLAVADHFAILEQWLRQAEQGTLPTHRVPWASPGWFSSATQWIQEQMTAFGLTLAGSLEQVQVSLWSTVLRIPTTTEALTTVAQRLGKLCRALTWGHLLAHLFPEERWEYEASYPYWLRVFLGTEE